MGNTLESNSESDITSAFSWCTGSNRRDREDDNIIKPKLPKPLDDEGIAATSTPGMGYSSTGYLKTPRTVRKSTAELAEVGMSEGKVKQRYLTHGNLDDAFADG